MSGLNDQYRFHRTHCNQGENPNNCKYGEETCPVMRDKQLKELLTKQISRILECFSLCPSEHRDKATKEICSKFEEVFKRGQEYATTEENLYRILLNLSGEASPPTLQLFGHRKWLAKKITEELKK